jgi:hypothetical protein
MKDSDKKDFVEVNISAVYEQVREILIQARARVWQAVNAEMVAAYWSVGRLIVNEEQQGNVRAEYGRGLIKELSARLTADFGKGYDQSNLWNMRAFYLAYPILDAVRRELSWTYYRLLIKIERADVCRFYMDECISANWSTCQPLSCHWSML